MTVKLIRVDFRLIHGQVITRWVKQANINHIVVIDDALSEDAFMQQVFQMAAPEGVGLSIFNTAEAKKAQEAGSLLKKNVLVLFKGVAELAKAYKAGIQMEEIQIGGLGGGPNRKAVHNAITLDEEDKDTLLELQNKGVKIYFQTTPDYPMETLDQVVEKF